MQPNTPRPRHFVERLQPGAVDIVERAAESLVGAMNLWLVLLAIWLVTAVPTWLGMLLLPLWRYAWPGAVDFAAASIVFAVVSLCWPAFVWRQLTATIGRSDFERDWIAGRRPAQDPASRLILVLVARPRVVISADRVERERLERYR